MEDATSYALGIQLLSTIPPLRYKASMRLDICDTVEFNLRSEKDDASRRAQAQEWGVVYIYEPAPATPPPAPTTPAPNNP